MIYKKKKKLIIDSVVKLLLGYCTEIRSRNEFVKKVRLLKTRRKTMKNAKIAKKLRNIL